MWPCKVAIKVSCALLVSVPDQCVKQSELLYLNVQAEEDVNPDKNRATLPCFTLRLILKKNVVSRINLLTTFLI
jgi:predicted component of type VI protein secretion system